MSTIKQPKVCSNSHNLNIQMYNFQELLNLFDLSSNIDIDDLKRAKMKVLMMHPDKSRLSSEYFIFYKKAFEIIVDFYNTQSKMKKEVAPTKYTNFVNTDYDKNTHNQLNTTINKMQSSDFNTKFNQLFDDNMGHAFKANEEKNQWFSQEDPIYKTESSKKNVNAAIDEIKQQKGVKSETKLICKK